MAKNFPNLRKVTDIQIQEDHKGLNKRNPKIQTLRHIIIKCSKLKTRTQKIQEKSNLLHARETHDHERIFQQTLYRPEKKWRFGEVAHLESVWKFHDLSPYVGLCISSNWLFLSYSL